MADTLGKTSDAPSSGKDKPSGLPPKGQEGQQAEDSQPAGQQSRSATGSGQAGARPRLAMSGGIDPRATEPSGLGKAAAYALSAVTVGRKLFSGR